jgi:carbamoyltransferase
VELEINSRIHRKTTQGDVVFGPSTDDSGIALGNAAYAYFKTTGRWPKKLLSASINRSMRAHTPSSSPKQIAKLLSEGTICGIVRSNSEAGPRALGYRSLLASAETTEMKTLVSERIKGRESYRPLAPIVTDKEFDRLFVGPRGKFMQYSVNCTDECKRIVPAIVHTDNTSRPQVVDANDPWLYDLLIEYGKLTGTECLINTSLNTDGRPIANDLVDAQYDFKQHPVQIFGV